MTFTIAWLDASEEEQRKVREVVQLFSQSETQDELGGRRIVVTLADALFPGTSVLHSRARYLLFIPWLCQMASKKPRPRRALDSMERQLIERFIEEGETDGLIGSQAGARVKQLPSTAYWTALEAWGILRWRGTIEQTLTRSATASSTASEDVDELAERRIVVWDPGVGVAPDGFPNSDIAGGFALTHREAAWLRDRLLLTAAGSMLEHLIRSAEPPSSSGTPWEEPGCLTAPPPVRRTLEEAERFAIAADGARLLYALMVAEAYKEAGFTTVSVDLDTYRDAISAWQERVHGRASLFDGWSTAEFWSYLRGRNSRIDELARKFFDTWFTVAQRGALGDLAQQEDLRRLIRARERFLKKSQARLENPKLLEAWRGGIAAPVTYRWLQVHRIVSDIVDGLERVDAGT